MLKGVLWRVAARDDSPRAQTSVGLHEERREEEVHISVYAIPLFKEAGSVRFAYIPVVHTPLQANPEAAHADACAGSTPSSSAAGHDSAPATPGAQGQRQTGRPTLYSRLAANTKSTWDNWGRMEKRCEDLGRTRARLCCVACQHGDTCLDFPPNQHLTPEPSVIAFEQDMVSMAV